MLGSIQVKKLRHSHRNLAYWRVALALVGSIGRTNSSVSIVNSRPFGFRFCQSDLETRTSISPAVMPLLRSAMALLMFPTLSCIALIAFLGYKHGNHPCWSASVTGSQSAQAGLQPKEQTLRVVEKCAPCPNVTCPTCPACATPASPRCPNNVDPIPLNHELMCVARRPVLVL